MNFRVLTEDDVGAIDRAAIGLLERTGVAVYEKQALDLLDSFGASVDRPRSRVRLPEKLVRDAVAKTPRRFKLAARDPSRSVTLGDGETRFTNSATGIKVLDPQSGEIRVSVLSDIPMFARLADVLDNIAFYGPTVVAHDVKGSLHFLEELVAGLRNTTKHVTHESHGTDMTKMYVELGRVVETSKEINISHRL